MSPEAKCEFQSCRKTYFQCLSVIDNLRIYNKKEQKLRQKKYLSEINNGHSFMTNINRIKINNIFNESIKEGLI